jgi:ABC-type Mn2+/Zn2+ transport system permease subunit
MITSDELRGQWMEWWLVLILHLFGFFLFAALYGVFLADQLKKDSGSSAIGIVFCVPAGMTVSVLIVYRSARKIRDIERILFH